jgi:hypothetical protein
MADAATKYSRTISARVDRAGPGAFGGMRHHVDLDFADKLLEESDAIARWCSECFMDGAT